MSDETPSNPFESPAVPATSALAFEVRPHGFFTRGRILTPQALGVDDVERIIEDGFGYPVYETGLIGADLVIMKSSWTGLAVKVKAREDGTEILFNPLAPSLGVRLLMSGLIPMLILAFGAWKDFGAEFVKWVETEHPFGS